MQVETNTEEFMKTSKTHAHQYDEVTHHCQCGAYRFQGFRDDEDQPPSEHFGPTAQRYRDDAISNMAELYADCE